MKRHNAVRIAVLTMVLLMFISGAAVAAPSVEDLLERIEQLEKRVAELEGERADARSVPFEKTEKGEISGVAYLSYDYHTSSDYKLSGFPAATPRYGDPKIGYYKSKNSFTVDRTYLKYSTTTGADTRYNFMVDASPDVNDGKSVFVKAANIEKTNAFIGGSLIFGLQENAWTGYEEKAWKYRAFERTAAHNFGLITSDADFGIGIRGKFFRDGDYHLLLSNGNGYDNNENSHRKEIQGRVSFTLDDHAPKLSLFGAAGGGEGWRSIANYGFLLSRQTRGFSYGLSGIWRKDKFICDWSWCDTSATRRVLSLYFSRDIPQTSLSVFGRIDRYAMSDVNLLRYSKGLGILGVAYKVDDTIRIIIGDEYKRGLSDPYDDESGYESYRDNALKATVEVGF